MALFKKESKNLVVRKSPDALITKESVLNYLDMSGVTKDLNDQEANMFIAVCVRNQLDPFRREAWPVPFKNDDGTRSISVVTGYEAYLRKADKSGKLEWWTCDVKGEGVDIECVVVVKVVDRPEFTWTTLLREVRKGGFFWSTMPIHMLKKTAIATTFRLAMPNVMKMLPHLAEEVGETKGMYETAAPPPPAPVKPEAMTATIVDEDEPGDPIGPAEPGPTIEKYSEVPLKPTSDEMFKEIISIFNNKMPGVKVPDDQKPLLMARAQKSNMSEEVLSELLEEMKGKYGT